MNTFDATPDDGYEPARVYTITPVIAVAMMAHNFNNRPLAKDTVRLYARFMSLGQWVVNGQTIIFSADGLLLDGQHRLEACIRSGCSFQTYIVGGLPGDVKKLIDGGKPRSIGDVLGFEGIPNSKKIAAVVKLIIAYEQGVILSQSDTRLTANRLEIVNRYWVDPEGFRDAVAEGERVHKGGCRITPAAASALAYLVTAAHPDIAQDYLDALATGAGMQPGDPRLAFRTWVINSRLRGKPIRSEIGLLTGIRVWNRWLSGDELTQVKPWARGNPMPEVEKP